MATPCLTPKSPAIKINPTEVYGNPRKTTGRAGHVIQGIAVHCLGESSDDYIKRVCTANSWRTSQKHASVHYVVNEDGVVTQLVDDADMAWSFQKYLGNFASTTPAVAMPGWTTLSAGNPGISPDFYTINVGIAVKPRPEYRNLAGCESCVQDACAGKPFGMTPNGYSVLLKLLAYLSNKYGISIDAQHLQLHDKIVDTQEGYEECLCNNVCLVCDVSAYCEPCENPGDAAYVSSTDIKYIYGESSYGCKVKTAYAADPPITFNVSNTIVATTAAPNGHNVTLEAKLAPAQAGVANRLQSIAGQGLYVPLDPLIFNDTESILGTASAPNGHTVSADLKIAPTQAGIANLLSVVAGQGVYAPRIPVAFGDTDTIDGSASGTDNHTISAAVKLAGVQSFVGNAVRTVVGQGLFVPKLPRSIEMRNIGSAINLAVGVFTDIPMTTILRDLDGQAIVALNSNEIIPAAAGVIHVDASVSVNMPATTGVVQPNTPNFALVTYLNGAVHRVIDEFSGHSNATLPDYVILSGGIDVKVNRGDSVKVRVIAVDVAGAAMTIGDDGNSNLQNWITAHFVEVD